MELSVVVPLAHLGHWAALLYAAPVLILLVWAGLARLRRWISVRAERRGVAGGAEGRS